MKNLKAFVAHSFEENDEQVVRKFLDYFDSLKDASGLVWDHAEKVEARAISQKVKDKMDGKNLFIGIFTAKDCKIKQNDLKTCLSIYSYGKKELFSIASSDWIIQESGYALAKGMTLVFLIENGVHVDAGLQGDLEFIEFKRDNPSECFEKIIQSLGNLLVEPSDISASQATASAPEIKKNDITEEQTASDALGTEKKVRKISPWDASKSLRKLIIDDKEIYEAEIKLKEIMKEYENDEAFPKSFWETYFYKLKLNAGFSDALSQLEKMIEDNPDDIYPLKTLGNIFREYGQYSKAAILFLQCSEKVQTNNEKIEYIGKVAECYALDKEYEDAYNIILKKYETDGLDTNGLVLVYKNLADVAKIQKNKNLYAAFAEKALTIFPTDYALRFSLAYSYYKTGCDINSLFHYKFLCEHNQNGINWNNLGVQYARLDFKAKSIESYYEAYKKYDETLAIANMAYRYIEEGFLNQASEILKPARLKDDHHENIDSALVRINEIRQKEVDSLEKALNAVQPEKEFMTKFAEAYVVPIKVNITGKWSSRHGDISLSVQDKKVGGETEIKFRSLSSSLAMARTGMLSGLQSDEDSKKIISVNAIINNCAVEYELKIITSSTGGTLLTGYGEHETVYEGLMVISDDAQIINAMEWEKGKHETEFYEMEKLQ